MIKTIYHKSLAFFEYKYSLCVLAFIALTCIKVSSWLSGYFLTPAISIFDPIFIILALLFILSVVIFYLAIVIFSKTKRKKAVVPLFISLFFALMLFIPGLSSVDGFYFRASLYEENEFKQLAKDLRGKYSEYGIDTPYTRFEDQRKIIDSLAPTYPILSVGLWSPRISVRRDEISLSWASGLVGGYQIIISEWALTQDYLDRLGRPAPRKLYDRVTLVMVN